jgi:protein-disulfide isomerase
MNRTFAIAFAITAAIAIGAVGYIVGNRVTIGAPGGASQAQVDALVKQAIADRAKATPIDASQPQATELSADQQTEVQDIIKNYLIANPQIIRDAINQLQIQEDAAAKQAQSQAIADNADVLFNSSRQIVLGNPKGDVTLVEFFDYNCTYCRASQQDMLDLIAKDPSLRVVLKEFPVLGDGSVAAAQIAVAVDLIAPDKYFAFHDELIRDKGQVDGDRALAVAEDVGVDPNAIKAKLTDPEIQATINESYDLAGKLSLTGTPSYVTRKEVIVGAVGYDTLRARLDDARNCVKTATC